MADEVRESLARTPRELPSKYFYDERGSRLFEEITELPEYYPTRAEWRLLELVAPEIAEIAEPREVVELGSGSSKKTRRLLEAALEHGKLERYVPLEFSREIVEDTAQDLVRDFPELRVHAVVGDFERHLGEIPGGRNRLVALLGSTIGNFERARAVEFLRGIAEIMEPEDRFLLGTDLVKDRGVLEAAYNDSRGVTAEFNKNVLRVVNRLLDADFDLDRFEHVAFFDEIEERIEMHLRSTRDQRVRVEGIDLELGLCAGEMIRTEVSCKYTQESAYSILRDAGFRMEHWFTTADGAFALSLSRTA